MFYNARWYDPTLGRFAQVDTIVPDLYNSQDYDRYAYSNNNPVRYVDPTGHWIESALDIAFIAYDIYDISANGLNWENGLSLAADVAGLALPVVTGGGLAVRAAMHVDDAAKVINSVDNVIDTANALDNAVDATKLGDDVTEIANTIDNAVDTANSADNSGITILGYSEDVRDYNGVNVNKLVDQPDWSWEGMNVPFLDDAMERGDTFVYVSDYTKSETRIFNREISYLKEKGYTRIIDMYHPQ